MRKRIGSFLYALLSLLLFCGPANATEPLKLAQLDHTMWTTRDGAPGHPMTMAQGPDGMLWIATEQGLYRFNGMTFSLYEPPVGEKWFSSASMLQVYAAKDGTIWTGSTRYGLAAIRDGHVTFYDQHNGLPDSAIKEITQAPDGTMWAVLGARRLMHLRSGHWYDEGGSLLTAEGVSLNFFDHNRTQWVATRKAVYFRHPGESQFKAAASQLRDGSDAVSFHETPNGKLLLGINYVLPQPHFEINQFTEDGDHTTPEPIQINQPGWFADMLLDGTGSGWILGKKGGRFDLPQGSAEKVRGAGKAAWTEEMFDSSPELGLGMVRAGIVDNQGDVWLATESTLHRFRRPTLVPFVERPLDEFQHDFGAGPDGSIWIATGGQPLLSLHNGVITEHGPPLVRPFSAFLTEDGVMWLSNGQSFRKVEQDRITEVASPPGVPAYTLRQALATPRHDYLMNFGRALWTLTNQGWNRTVLPFPPDFSPNKFFYDSAGRLWIGSSTGQIACFDGSKVHTLSAKASGDLGMILSFFEDGDGLLAGGFKGVAIYKHGAAHRIQVEHPSTLSGISGMVKDKYGNLWLNGLRGVVRIPKAELERAIESPSYLAHSESFLESGAGPAPQWILSTAGKGDDGHLWFNTSRVIVHVDPDDVQVSRIAPVLSLASVTADGLPLGPGGRVASGEHTLRIAYFGANLASPESVTYRYRLDGVDDRMQDVGSRTEAVYTHLRPGKYVFHMIASGGEGVWSQPLETRFTVLPAFYQTIWFLFAFASLCAVLLWMLITWRIQHVAKTMSMLALVRANERVVIARDLHDTLLQGVQALTIHCHIALQAVGQDTAAHHALSKALTKADLVLVEAREKVRGLRSPISKHTTLTQAFTELGAEMNGAGPTAFHVETRGPAIPLKAQVVTEIYSAGREALINAMHHAEADNITLTIAYGMRRLTMTCRDDGRGMPEGSHTRHGHWGMMGMHERATRVGGRFDCHSGVGAGTEIVISVPARLAYDVLPIAQTLLKRLLPKARGADRRA